jgi:hypothetical protein
LSSHHKNTRTSSFMPLTEFQIIQLKTGRNARTNRKIHNYGQKFQNLFSIIDRIIDRNEYKYGRF